MGETARRIIFSANCLLAVAIAFFIAFSLDLQRPYWAMATVYIVSQPLAGAVRSKALYRLLGTLIGAVAAVALVPAFYDEPAALSLALAAWVGLCLYMSLQDRSPRSYVFLLAGYTAAIIGFPVAPAPELVFATAVARTEEITLGLVSATVVHSVVAPQGVGPALVARMEKWFDDAQAWILSVLAAREGELPEERRELASDAAQIRLLTAHLAFDTSDLRGMVRIVQGLHDQMTFLVPIVGAVGDRLAALRRERALPPEAERLVERVADWVGDRRRPAAEGQALIGELAASAPRLSDPPSWTEALTENLLDRLAQLVQAVLGVRELRAAFEQPWKRPPHGLVSARRARTPYHRDRYLAGLSAAAAMLSICGCCALWIATSWPEGSVAALTAATFCSFFAAQDDPAPAIANFLRLTLASLPLVAFYQFVVLPAIDGYVLLMASLAPTLLVLGYFVGDARTSPKSLPLAIGFSNGLALAELFSADFAGFANSSVAQVIGFTAALVATRLMRRAGTGWAVRRILRGGWRDVARLAAARSDPDLTDFRLRMLDRLGLVSDRMALLGPGEAGPDVDPLRDMRIGLNIDELRRARRGLDEGAAERAADLLASLAAFYRGRAAGREAATAPDQALQRLDRALLAVRPERDRSGREAVRALVGLRRALFPAAAPYPSAASPSPGGG